MPVRDTTARNHFMKKILLLTLMLVSIRGFSQAGYEDVIYLKNGSIIHGVIIEQIPNVSIKIKNHGGDVFFYKIEEIEKFTKEEPQAKPKQQSKFIEAATAKPIEPKDEKVKMKFAFDSIPLHATGTIEIGGIFGLPNKTLYFKGSASAGTSVAPTKTLRVNQPFAISMAEIRIVIDRPLTRRLSVGGGFNVDLGAFDVVTNNGTPVTLILPAYFNVKYSFLKRKVSPFLAGQMGASFYYGDYVGGGAMGAVQFGIKAYVAQRVALNAALGYRFQHIASTSPYQYTDETGNNTISIGNNHYLLNFISLHFGVTF
jgi:hypothetical protein